MVSNSKDKSAAKGGNGGYDDLLEMADFDDSDNYDDGAAGDNMNSAKMQH